MVRMFCIRAIILREDKNKHLDRKYTDRYNYKHSDYKNTDV